MNQSLVFQDENQYSIFLSYMVVLYWYSAKSNCSIRNIFPWAFHVLYATTTPPIPLSSRACYINNTADGN